MQRLPAYRVFAHALPDDTRDRRVVGDFWKRYFEHIFGVVNVLVVGVVEADVYRVTRLFKTIRLQIAEAMMMHANISVHAPMCSVSCLSMVSGD